MNTDIFKLHNPFLPAGDQPLAIKKLLEGLNKGFKKQTLLGATGTGKTLPWQMLLQSIINPH